LGIQNQFRALNSKRTRATAQVTLLVDKPRQAICQSSKTSTPHSVHHLWQEDSTHVLEKGGTMDRHSMGYGKEMIDSHQYLGWNITAAVLNTTIFI
jgi:hypothetical protein